MSRYSCWVDLLALTVVLGSVSCGGNAQSGPGTGAQGGASDLGSVGGGGAQGGASDLGSAGGVGGVGGVGGAGGQSETTPAPSSISVIVGSDGPLVDPDPVATCLNGFQGFSSSVDGLSIEFEAFISEPGRYEGDPLRILYLSVKMPDGSEYCATGGLVVCLGAITLIARSVGPRFTGELEAELVNRSDAAAPTLSLRLSFDVASRAGCQ